jgi:hypothetical protein
MVRQYPTYLITRYKFRQRNFAFVVEMRELPQGGAAKEKYRIMVVFSGNTCLLFS